MVEKGRRFALNHSLSLVRHDKWKELDQFQIFYLLSLLSWQRDLISNFHKYNGLGLKINTRKESIYFLMILLALNSLLRVYIAC